MEELHTQNCPAGSKPTIQFSFKKKITFSLIIFVILFLFTWIVGETLVRILTNPPLYIAHPVLGSTLRPNVTTEHIKGDLRQVVKINSFGFHDEEYPLEKPDNAKRILILGDSYIEALQVPIEKTFAKLLQTNLNLRIDEFEVQTINTGRSGRGVLEYYLTLRAVGWDFQPDLVLAAFYMNDVFNDWEVQSQIEFDEAGRPVRFKNVGILPIPLSAKRVMHHSHFYYFLMERATILYRKLKAFEWNRETEAGETPKPIKEDHFEILRGNYTENKYKAWDLTRKTLGDMNQECHENGSKFMLMIIPWESQFDPRKTAATEYWRLEKVTEEPQRILKQLGEDEDFSVLDLLPYFRNVDDLPLHGDEDGHWNEKGNFYAAQAAAEFILTQQLLQEK